MRPFVAHSDKTHTTLHLSPFKTDVLFYKHCSQLFLTIRELWHTVCLSIKLCRFKDVRLVRHAAISFQKRLCTRREMTTFLTLFGNNATYCQNTIIEHLFSLPHVQESFVWSHPGPQTRQSVYFSIHRAEKPDAEFGNIWYWYHSTRVLILQGCILSKSVNGKYTVDEVLEVTLPRGV